MTAKLAQTLTRQAAQFERLARTTQRSMSVEGVHDLRVLTRRVRACVWMARQIHDAVSLRKLRRALRRALRRVGRALGERRMFDVAVEDAGAYGMDAAALEVPRAYAGAVAARRLKAGRREEIAKLMRKAAKALAGRESKALAGGLELLRSRLQAALDQAPQGKTEQHELRIQAKKVRYVLEILGRPVDKLKALQSELGRAHDLEVLQELLGPQEQAAADESAAWDRARGMMRETVAAATSELNACRAALKAGRQKGRQRKAS